MLPWLFIARSPCKCQKTFYLPIINMKKMKRHVGSYDQGDCVVMVGNWNSHESQSKGGGKEEIRIAFVWKQTNSTPNGNTHNFLFHPWFLTFALLLFASSFDLFFSFQNVSTFFSFVHWICMFEIFTFS
jgi:hypothetical protein